MNEQCEIESAEAVGELPFLQRSAIGELARLRGELALHRGVLRDQRRHFWERDRAWQVKKFEAIKETKLRIQKAGKSLTDFVHHHKIFIGDVPNKGRLCWHCFLGGLPIDTHYCQLPEGHDGSHCNSVGAWVGLPKHPEPKAAKPIIRLIMAELADNMARFGSEWGKRSGPSILLFRDTSWYQHPFRRALSCLGCVHLVISDDKYHSPRCAHPEMLSKYGCAQAVAASGPKYLTTPCQCSALTSEVESLTQPHPCLIKSQ